MFELKDSYLIFDFWAEKKVENKAILLTGLLDSSRTEP